eukprot:GGOE01055644.1.p1 GENE.GGOE01055644.1~~GGOE01055644.1.p1  ORF type:complete len:532 (-),score=149.69 GGOE01055644.1:254-1849(-)
MAEAPLPNAGEAKGGISSSLHTFHDHGAVQHPHGNPEAEPPHFSTLWGLLHQPVLHGGWHRLPGSGEEEEEEENGFEMDFLEDHRPLAAISAEESLPDSLVPAADQLTFVARTASLTTMSAAPSLDLELAHQQALRHRGVGLARTFIIVVKSFIGTGILTMPRAFFNGGLLFAPMVMAAVGVYSLVCMMLLVKCRQKVHGPCGFADLGKMAYGPWMGWLIKVSIVLSQCGFCAGYYIFISHNLLQVMASFGLQLPWLSEAWLVCFQLVIHIPFALIRQMKHFAAPALVAELCIFGGVFCITGYSIYVIHTPAWHAARPALRLFNEQHFAICIGMVISAFEGIAVVLPIHDAMSRPSKFNSLLAGNILLMLATYASFAGIGYIAFGSGVHDVIILNLPQKSLLSCSIQLAYCLAVVFTFPLQLFPVLQVLEKGTRRTPIQTNLFRAAIVTFVAVVAVLSTEHLEHLMSVVGALCCTPLAFTFPSIIHYKLAAVHWYEKFLDIVYAMLGCVVMGYVLYISVLEWVHASAPSTL